MPSRVRDHAALSALLRPAGAGAPAARGRRAAPAPTPRRCSGSSGRSCGAGCSSARSGTATASCSPLGPEHVAGLHDGTELLLARVTVPAVVDAGAGRPRLDPGRDLAVDNDVRLYSYGNAELALLAGLER